MDLVREFEAAILGSDSKTGTDAEGRPGMALSKFFAQLTGFQLQIIPISSPLSATGQREVPCPIARRMSMAYGAAPRTCAACLQDQWRLNGQSAQAVRRFVGYCGGTNVCVLVRCDAVASLALMSQVRKRAGPFITDKELDCAETMLRLIAHVLAGMARNREAEPRCENEVVRGALPRVTAPPPAARLADETPLAPEGARGPVRAWQVARAMLDYTEQHCHRPMGLKDVASHLQMNANYLSSVFHQAVGISFHEHLQTLRLSRAEHYLRDPLARVCDVACAAGFATPNHFRSVFKARKGVSPSAWRRQPPEATAEAAGI